MPPPRLHDLLAVIAVLVLVTAGCSRADRDLAGKGSEPQPAKDEPVAPAPGAQQVQFTITGIEPNGTQPPDEATVAAVKTALEQWTALAVVTPLHTGQPAGDLSAVFTAPALERLGDPAVRAALVDEGMPAASTEVSAAAANAALFSVAGRDGAVGVVAAHIELAVHAVGPGLDVDISRSGDLVLVPDEGSWKIDAFGIHTTRNSRGA